MVTKHLIHEIHTAYQQLEAKKLELTRALRHPAFEIESGWYNGHYQRDNNGEWQRDSYPIPVIGVKGLCDIEVQFESLSVSTKRKRDTALAYSYEKLAGYDFEAYGVEDYLADYYHAGQTLQDLKDAINCCEETEIGFSFIFSFETDGKQVLEFIKMLQSEGFYY